MSRQTMQHRGARDWVNFEVLLLRRSRNRRLGLTLAYCYRQHHTQSLAFPPSERQSSAHTTRRQISLSEGFVQQDSTKPSLGQRKKVASEGFVQVRCTKPSPTE